MIFPIGLQYGVTNEGPITLFVSGSDRTLARIDKEPGSPESIQGEFAEFHRMLSYLLNTINERCRLIFERHKFRAEIIQRQNSASEKRMLRRDNEPASPVFEHSFYLRYYHEQQCHFSCRS